MSTFKASLALAVGYLLIYAAVSNGGAYATSPWKALSQ